MSKKTEKEKSLVCKICCSTADGMHFGVLSCQSCKVCFSFSSFLFLYNKNSILKGIFQKDYCKKNTTKLPIQK